ncbi:hypothetical protein CsSME_00053740 [Camellia sinensis var. sinensis]
MQKIPKACVVFRDGVCDLHKVRSHASNATFAPNSSIQSTLKFNCKIEALFHCDFSNVPTLRGVCFSFSESTYGF